MRGEKCYAKIHGSYANLNAGSVSEALADLTGGVSQKLLLTDSGAKAMITDGTLWARLQKYIKFNYLLGCSKNVKDEAAEASGGPSRLRAARASRRASDLAAAHARARTRKRTAARTQPHAHSRATGTPHTNARARARARAQARTRPRAALLPPKPPSPSPPRRPLTPAPLGPPRPPARASW